MAIWLTEDSEANELLEREPLALLTGMLLDQQIPIEVAFAGPKKLLDRMGSLDAGTIASYDQEKFLAICATPPAIHRFPGSMGKRVQALCQAIAAEYDGRAETSGPRATRTAPRFSSGSRRCRASATPRPRSSLPCWASSAAWPRPAGSRPRGDYATPLHISVADITDPESLQHVRAYKKEMKAAAKAKKG